MMKCPQCSEKLYEVVVAGKEIVAYNCNTCNTSFSKCSHCKTFKLVQTDTDLICEGCGYSANDHATKLASFLRLII